MTQTDMLKLGIRGFIIDIDGVLYIDKNVVPGAIRTIQYLICVNPRKGSVLE